MPTNHYVLREHLAIFRFSSLGIQCAKINEVENALKERAEIKVDPFASESSIVTDAPRDCSAQILFTYFVHNYQKLITSTNFITL